MQDTPKLLLIEDDRQIAYALSYALRSAYQVEVATTGQTGLDKNIYESYAAIVLDLNLPDLPGLDVCRQLREQAVTAPILVLSAENDILTKINLLDAGANDYLVKPFSLGELKARLRVLARYNRNQMQQNRRLEFADLILDSATREVNRNGQTISLRRKEFALLECLMAHAGTVVTRETLIKYAWQDTTEPWTNTIDVHIKYLRDKLDRPFGSQLIKTVHGIGYRLDPAQATTLAECVA